MPPDASPLPIRRPNPRPHTPTRGWNTPLLIEDDELAGDTIPCSPGAFLRDRDSTTTQPTQIMSRPSLTAFDASSPASIVEVPASSPFQPKQSMGLGSRLAPAGTIFRPPPRSSNTVPSKRPAPEPISLLSDDDDDDDEDGEGGFNAFRGDIRPTSFKSQISAFTYNPEAEERKTRERLRQIYDVLGDAHPSDVVREALKACKNDLDDAIVWLEDRDAKQAAKPRAPAPAPAPANGRRLITKGELLKNAKSSRPTSRLPSPTFAHASSKQPKRRLMQGLRQRSSPQKDPVDLGPAPPSSDDPIITHVTHVVENDEDMYKAERSPSPDADENETLLGCINNSTIKELAAITGEREETLEPLIDKRPFSNLYQARKVSAGKKPGAKKVSRVSIGEKVVDAVEIFMNAVTAIDKVVTKCDAKAQLVKSVVDGWDLDAFGHIKKSTKASPDDTELPPTPTSMNGLSRPLVPEQPSAMDGHCEMKSFQLFGLNWLTLLRNYEIGCILADEMGLGKTCQVISLICHLVENYNAGKEAERPWPNLIVVPPSTYNNWLAEFEKFAPSLSVCGYRGSQSERAEIAYEVGNNLEDYHVVLATYSQINSEADIEAMQSFDLHAAIFDEGHKMKNPETKVYKDLKRIPAEWKVLLTGTPVQNNLLEMVSLLSFINPKIFEGYMEQIRFIFSQKVTIRDVSNGAFLYTERVRRARTILEPFILQRRKDQVLTDMPRKINNVVHCELSDTQRPVYDEYEELFKLEPSERASRAKGRMNDQNNAWMQLRKAALHPLLFRRHFDEAKVEEMGKILMDRIPQSELHQPDIKHLVQELKNSSDFELHLWCRDYSRLLKRFDLPVTAKLESGKVQKLLELIAQYQSNGDRVLVFSKFSRIVEMLQEILALRDIDHRVLMGNTNVADRQTLIDEFNEDSSIPVFLLTTGAGGTGINLTAANKVIIFDQSDNPQDDIQAENRAHRLGQTRDVEVIRLISTGTIEELIYKACQKKIELANKVTGATEEESAEDAGKNLEKEVRKMLKEQMTPP